MLKYLLALSVICGLYPTLAAQVIINEIADPSNDARARFVELYNVGPANVDLAGYLLRRYTNDKTTSDDVTLKAGTILAPGKYYVIANFADTFAAKYPTYPAPNQLAFEVNTNGDDSYELFDGNSVVDSYGVPGTDGTGEDWEYEDAIVDRVSQTQNLGAFSVAQFRITDPGTTADASPGAAPLRPVPVTLVSFEATALGDGAVALAWVTLAELGNDYFEVERSADGEGFSTVGRVAGAGNSSERQAYEYLHHAGERGAVYYRLTQVDFDGTRTASAVVGVDLGESTAALALASTHVAAGGHLRVQQAGLRTLRVVDMRGAVVAEFGPRMGSQPLDVGGLPTGVYVLTDGRSSVRFVRM